MTRRVAAALAAALLGVPLAGCGGDDEPDTQTSGAATATATTTTPAATQTSTTGRTSTSAGDPPRAAGPEQQVVAAVRACLARQGYTATGGVRPPGTPDAPSYEILVAGPRGSAFIAFSETLADARRYAARLRRNADRFKGAEVERQGTITTAWVELTDTAARIRIRDCVRQEA